MEGSPLNPPNRAEDKESSGKKKSVKAIGGYAVEPKPAAPKSTPTKPEVNLWLPPAETDTKPASNTEASVELSVAHDTETKSEVEAPLESLSEVEQQVIISKLAAAAELGHGEQSLEAEDDPVEAVGEQAVKRFRRHLIEDGVGIEAASAETLAELHTEPEATDLPTGSDESEVPQFGLSSDPEYPNDFEDEVVIDRSQEASPSIFDAENEPTIPIVSTPETEIEDANVPPSGGAGGAGTPPPRGPNPPFGPPIGAGVTPPGGPGFNPNAAPATTRVEYYDRGNDIGMLILGGIIGYLIGRRRGRIKTEKKLLPIQKKLEKEVKGLQHRLQTAETEIRTTAIKQAREARAHQLPRRTEKLPTPKATPEKSHPTPRDVAPEAHQLHGKSRTAEHVGHVLIDVPERNRSSKHHETETAADKASLEQTISSEPEPKHIPESPAKLTTEKSVQTMSRAELLTLSEKIVVDGSSLRQVYETNLVGERGLRRLINEHLRGGDVKKILRQEIVEHEIDFERDPVMRDHVSNASSGSGGGALDDLLHQAAVVNHGDTEETKFLTSRANYEASQQELWRKRRRIIDVSLTGTIIILLGLIVTLYLARG